MPVYVKASRRAKAYVRSAAKRGSVLAQSKRLFGIIGRAKDNSYKRYLKTNGQVWKRKAMISKLELMHEGTNMSLMQKRLKGRRSSAY